MTKINTELFILGEPIETDIGDARFFAVRDMHILEKYRLMFQFNKHRLLEFLRFQNREAYEYYRIIFEDIDYISMIYAFGDEAFKDTMFSEIYEANREIFKYVFGYDVFEEIMLTQEEYNYYFELIAEMNRITPHTVNPNPRIRQRDAARQYIASSQGDSVSTQGMISSVALVMGFSEVRELTIYQLEEMFGRMTKFDQYMVTRIGSFISSETDVISWAGDIKKEENAQKTITDKDLQQTKAVDISKNGKDINS